MVRKTLSLLVIALFFGFEVGLAQNVGTGLESDPEVDNSRVGTRGANFLEIPVGARAQALAGAGAPLQSGVYGLYWNPATIASVEEFSVAFSYTELYQDLDIDYFFAGGAVQFGGGVLGIAFGGLSSGDIARTTENFPEGGDPIFGDVFEWNSTFVGGYYARQITDRLQVGGGIKFISEGIDNAAADWVAFDGGVAFRTGLLGLELAAVAQNIGNTASFRGQAVERIIPDEDQLFGSVGRDITTLFDTQEMNLPALFRFSVLLNVVGAPESLLETPTQDHGVTVAVNIMDAVDTNVQSAIGFEYNFRGIAFGRIGKRFFSEDQRTGGIQSSLTGVDDGFFRQDDFRDFSDGLAFGGGIRLPVLGRSFAVDYAYVDRGELESLQTISFELGGF